MDEEKQAVDEEATRIEEPEGMTKTQTQVFRLAALGKSDREIAEQQLISPSAVRSILEHRMRQP